MKTTIISVIIFILIFAGAGYLVRAQDIPVLSQIGSDINSTFLENSSDLSQVAFQEEVQEVQEESEVEVQEVQEESEVEVQEETLLETEVDIPLCSDNVLNIGQDFINNLNSCSNYKCKFAHPFSPDTLMLREIENYGSNCLYTEEMPNDGLMTCTFSEEERLAAANYYQSVINASEVSTRFSVNFDAENTETEVFEEIDGEVSEFTLNDFLSNGTCVVTGYDY